MFLYFNDSDYAVSISHLHYNHIDRNEDPRMRIELALTDTINDDIEFLVSLAKLPITHIVIKNDTKERNLYDLTGNFVIDELSDSVDNQERNVNLTLAREVAE